MSSRGPLHPQIQHRWAAYMYCRGTGTSGIAHTVAQAFHEQNRLGAAIFLREGVLGATADLIMSTIVSQLAGYDTQLQSRIAAKIKCDPSLASADIRRQFCALVVDTTNAAADMGSRLMMIGPVLIIIDGLNKIHEEEQHNLLAVFCRLFYQTSPQLSHPLHVAAARYGHDNVTSACIL